jgi:hypothetical protein
MSDEPVRKKIPMPRSNYIDQDGDPVDRLWGPFRYWPREAQASYIRYSNYLDRLWAKDEILARRVRRG